MTRKARGKRKPRVRITVAHEPGPWVLYVDGEPCEDNRYLTKATALADARRIGRHLWRAGQRAELHAQTKAGRWREEAALREKAEARRQRRVTQDGR